MRVDILIILENNVAINMDSLTALLIVTYGMLIK